MKEFIYTSFLLVINIGNETLSDDLEGRSNVLIKIEKGSKIRHSEHFFDTQNI